jgi:hypothetical protein
MGLWAAVILTNMKMLLLRTSAPPFSNRLLLTAWKYSRQREEAYFRIIIVERHSIFDQLLHPGRLADVYPSRPSLARRPTEPIRGSRICSSGLRIITPNTEVVEKHNRSQRVEENPWLKDCDRKTRVAMGATSSTNLLRIHCQCRDEDIYSIGRTGCFDQLLVLITTHIHCYPMHKYVQANSFSNRWTDSWLTLTAKIQIINCQNH